MANFVLLRDDEPRGEPFGEPRADELWLDQGDECWRNEEGDSVCAARLTDRPWKWRRCQQSNTSDNGRCRHHGGLSPSGKDHSQFKHGKYSQDLPSRLAQRYHEVKEDESLTNLREEIALIETRIHAVLAALDAKDSARLWKDIEQEFSKFKAAQATGDQQEMMKRIRALTSLIEEGAEERSKWNEVGDLVERKRKLVESERKREKALQAYVPLERLSILLTTIDEIIRRHVDDDEVMREIARDIKQTVSLG